MGETAEGNREKRQFDDLRHRYCPKRSAVVDRLLLACRGTLTFTELSPFSALAWALADGGGDCMVKVKMVLKRAHDATRLINELPTFLDAPSCAGHPDMAAAVPRRRWENAAE